jgi:PIN domain nuclease of toxin-antitoxin system
LKTKRPLLFDLQAVVFWAHGEVPEPVIRRVHESNRIYVSIVSLWEFLLKHNRQSFGIDYGQLLQTVRLLRADLLPIRETHLNTLLSMPIIDKHNDPFDRLLIAQALREDFILVGNDQKFAPYQDAFSLKLLWA